MVKHFCDACGTEIEGTKFQLPLLHHIVSEERTYMTMVNNKWHGISGVTRNQDLCIQCYNAAATAAWEEIKKIQNSKDSKYGK